MDLTQSDAVSPSQGPDLSALVEEKLVGLLVVENADFWDAEGEYVFRGGHLAEVQQHEGVLTLDCDGEVGLK